jgi:sporulation protein YlmC with PRC-barrel domain
MLKLYESIPGTKIMSLRTGSPVASVIKPIINPNNLYIEGWYVQETSGQKRLVLLSNDIRDVLPQGFVINDYEVLSQPGELVRLQEIMEINFHLMNLRVVSESGKNYGKINDYAFETANFFIQKLYVGQSLVKNFSGGTFSVDRSQIIEISNKQIVIEDATEKAGAGAASPIAG